MWDTIDEIDLDDLPDEFVVKSIGGAGGRGVLPLRRVPGGWTVASEGGVLTAVDVRERFRTHEDGGKVDGPYFAEEFLGSADVLPADVKVSAFFGEVSHVLLRTVGTHLDATSLRFRIVLPDRTDMGDVLGPGFPHDPEIPIPDTFDQLIESAVILSCAIPRPYMRIDLYDVGGRVVFGELTPRPGGPQVFGAEQDDRLGRYWERAQARLTDDLVDGGGLGLRFGPGPRDLVIGSSGSRRFDVPGPE